MILQMQVLHEEGLHARPAAMFVKTANSYRSTIKVRNCSAGKQWVNAKSILNILSIGVQASHEIEVDIEGDDASQAAEALQALVETNFE